METQIKSLITGALIFLAGATGGYFIRGDAPHPQQCREKPGIERTIRNEHRPMPGSAHKGYIVHNKSWQGDHNQRPEMHNMHRMPYMPRPERVHESYARPEDNPRDNHYRPGK